MAYYNLKPGETYNKGYLDWMNSGDKSNNRSGEVAYGPEAPIQNIPGAMPAGIQNPPVPSQSTYRPYDIPQSRPLSKEDFSFSNGMYDSMEDAPSYTSPDLGKADYRELPTYAPQKWDDAEVESLAQKKAMPGIRELRSQVQRVTGRRFDNPNVGRMTLREALQGYGSGLGSVISGAGAAAIGEYGTKFGRESEEGRAAYASQADRDKSYNTSAQNDWRFKGDAALEGARQNYAGKLRGYDARTNIAGKSIEDVRGYELQKRGFDDAWTRWKKQQNEKNLAGSY